MRFRVASFNTENLILPGIRYYDRLKDTDGIYAAKANWIASVLDRIKPDIVGFQEVWLDEALHDVVSRSFAFSGRNPEIVAPGASRGENIRGHLAGRPRLALVSCFPVKSATVTASFPVTVDLTVPLRVDGGTIVSIPVAITQFQRPVLRAVVEIAGHDVVVYVAHLKSKGPLVREGEDGGDPFIAALGQARATFVRAAEAAALRHLILADLSRSKKPVIVLGDLNDTPDSASTQTVRGPAPRRDMERSERRTLWDVVLYSTVRIAFERSPSVHTHIHEGERDILDHILVSEEFFPRNRARIGTVLRHEVVNDHLREDALRSPGASDHGIPVAEIALRG